MVKKTRKHKVHAGLPQKTKTVTRPAGSSATKGLVQEALDKLMKVIPYKRIGEPQDIGYTAVWLASDLSDYINGTSIFVDGGMTLYPEFTENG